MAEDWTKYQVSDSSDTNKHDWSQYQVKSDTKEESNTLASLWHRAISPTVNLVSDKDVEQFTTPSLDESPISARLRGFIGGAMKGGSDLVSTLTSPLNIATAGMGSLEELTGSKLAQIGTKALSAPVVGHGLHDLFSPSSTLNERLSSIPEIAGGVLGLRSRTPEIGLRAMEQQPSMPSSNLLPEEELQHRPDLMPVGAENEFNEYRRNEPIDLEGKTLDLASTRQNMGRPNLTVDQVNGIFSNPPPLKEGTTINFGTKKPTNSGPRVTSLKPATPELIQQAQAKGPDVIHLKTADKTQLENAAQYGYEFEGVNSDGSLRLKKNPIDVPSNESGGGGGDDEPPNSGHIGDIVDRRKGTIAQEVMNLPRGIMASWDLSAPFRQGLGLVHRPEFWKSFNTMFKSFGSENAFRAVQDSIVEKPLFKSYNDQPSFAEKSGLKLTDLTDLSKREEQIMSTWAEKIPGVRPSNRAYTAFLNKLRADTFESMMESANVINKGEGKGYGAIGEIDMPLAKEIANYVNTATGRGSLGSLEKYAVPLNSLFFSPRLIASRLTMLNPMYYMTASAPVRNEAIKSLLAIAGTGTLVSQLGRLAGGTVENDPTSSDFGKLKIGNTRIDPYGGFQQYIVAANRLLQGRTTSSVSGKSTDLNSGRFGSQTRFDVAERFGESKLNPLIGLATTILRGKNLAGQKADIPEEIAQRFIPLFVQDLKNVATENPNLIPYYHESGLGFENTDMGRGSLALPGAVGFGIQNYNSR